VGSDEDTTEKMKRGSENASRLQLCFGGARLDDLEVAGKVSRCDEIQAK
jgi:hypothetical protein